MSNQPKNNLFDKKLNIYFLLFNTLLILIAFIVCISLSIIYKNYSIVYGCLINIPFIYFCLLFGFVTNKLILKNTNKEVIDLEHQLDELLEFNQQLFLKAE